MNHRTISMGVLLLVLLLLDGCSARSQLSTPLENETVAQNLSGGQEGRQAEAAATSAIETGSAQNASDSSVDSWDAKFSTEPLQLAQTKCSFTRTAFTCTADDQMISAKIYIPNDGAQTHPVVILSHGFNNIGDWMMRKAQSLASAGIAAVTFDFRGGSPFSASQGKTVNMTIGTECHDLHAVVYAVKQMESVDPERIYLLGESYGGLVSALVAAQREDIAGLILCFPAFHSADVARSFFPNVSAIPEELPSGNGMVTGKAMWEELWNMDIFGDIARYAGEVIILHGTADTDVPLEYASFANRVYKNSQLFVMEGVGHGFSGNDLKSAYKTIYQFVTKRDGMK